MYIKFNLPSDGGYTATMSAIKIAVARWARDQEIKYTDKTIKFQYRVAFDQDNHYTIFALTWNSPFVYKIIDTKW